MFSVGAVIVLTFHKLLTEGQRLHTLLDLIVFWGRFRMLLQVFVHFLHLRSRMIFLTKRLGLDRRAIFRLLWVEMTKFLTRFFKMGSPIFRSLAFATRFSHEPAITVIVLC